VRRGWTTPEAAAVVLLFAAGAALRVWFLVGYRPAFMGFKDSEGYVRAAQSDLFLSDFRPGGYPLFLRLPHLVSANLSFTIALQHLLGLATAALLYLALRRLGASRWASLVPAAVILLAGLQLFLENAVMSEPVFAFGVAVALYALIRALEGHPVAWSSAAGLFLGAAATTRGVGLALVPAAGLWPLARPGGWRPALASAAAVCAGGALVIGGYEAAQFAERGQFGLTRTDGLYAYARVAPFADCRRFRPPAGTRRLCESSAPEQRGDAIYYVFDDSSPANRLFRDPVKADPHLRAFALAAVLHQPVDYVATVGRDFALYALDEDRGLVRYLQYPAGEREAVRPLAGYYRFRGYRRPAARELSAYGTTVSLGGWPTAALIALAALAPFVTRGRVRLGAVAFAGTGLLLLVVPVMTLYEELRFSVPAYGPLAAAAALGAEALLDRARAGPK
jgi:hypothetical protein